MAYVDDVVSSTLAAVKTTAGYHRVIGWTTERLRELNNRIRLRSLREIGELPIPALIEAGTVSATRGSNIVTGDATAQAAWTVPLVGRHIRLTSRNEWYEIGAVVNEAGVISLRLVSEFADDDAPSVGYKLVQRFTPLDKRVRHLGDFVFMRMRRRLDTLSLTEANMTHPDRLFTKAGGPHYVIEIGTGEDGRRIVELYPYSGDTEIVHYVFWPEIPRLEGSDVLPRGVDAYVLKIGVLADVMRYEMSVANSMGNVEAAAVWRNDYRAQHTSWENAIMDAQRADKGLDDVTLVLTSDAFSFSQRPLFRNYSARTEVFLRGDRT